MGIDVSDLPPRMRASIDGQVPEDINYDTFLRRQTAEFQNEVLGPSRADLFRDGMAVDRFTDRAGNELTLAQLRQRL